MTKSRQHTENSYEAVDEENYDVIEDFPKYCTTRRRKRKGGACRKKIQWILWILISALFIMLMALLCLGTVVQSDEIQRLTKRFHKTNLEKNPSTATSYIGNAHEVDDNHDNADNDTYVPYSAELAPFLPQPEDNDTSPPLAETMEYYDGAFKNDADEYEDYYSHIDSSLFDPDDKSKTQANNATNSTINIQENAATPVIHVPHFDAGAKRKTNPHL